MRRLFALLLLGLPACLVFTEHDGPFRCGNDGDCLDGKVCRPLLGGRDYKHCAEPDVCSRNAECAYKGEGFYCADGRCKPQECATGSDTCAPYVCVDHACPTACEADGWCLDGHTCVDGACTP